MIRVDRITGHYLATPVSYLDGAVIVLPAWWGLTPFFKELCDRLAGEGYATLGFDLYHGAMAATIAEAEQMSSDLHADTVANEILRAVEMLRVQPGVGTREIGVVGFSLGASYAMWLAEQIEARVAAAVVFYGTGGEKLQNSEAAYQGHFAEHDDYEPAEYVQKLEGALQKAGKRSQFYIYPGTGHWFFESDRPQSYQPQAAQLAWQRMLQFLKVNLGRTGE